ncbi:MAG TPA: response regulator transcription factor [Chloroflexota bacterium]
MAAQLLLASPDPLARAGLRALLEGEADVLVVGETALEDLEEALRQHQPQVLVVDAGTAEAAHLALEAVAGALGVTLVFLTVESVAPLLARVAGASLLRREADVETLVAGLRAVVRGLVVVDPSLVEPRYLLAPTMRREEPLGEDLTPREREVLQLMADGLPNKAIARRLGISEHTVKFHIGSILAKLGAASRTEAVAVAARQGLLLL